MPAMAPNDPEDRKSEVHTVVVSLPDVGIVERAGPAAEEPVEEPPLESLPVLGPEHEIHDDEPPLESLPVLGPEHEIPNEPLLAQVIDSELPSLDPSEAPPLLAQVIDSELPSLDPSEAPPLLAQVIDSQLPSPDPSDAPPLGRETSPPESESEPETEEERLASAAMGDYRKLYVAEFSLMPRDARIAIARTAQATSLLALCFDPEPAVIAAVFENAHAGLDHARLAALHHKNPAGLEHVVKRTDFLRDAGVQRHLLKNTQLSESLIRRLIGAKPLREMYKTAINRDVAERARIGARTLLRTKWASSEPDERAAFIISNEARCLSLLIGQTLDAKTTSILCARQYNSVLFIQNLARFPACPPALLAHLLKQPFVKRNVGIKKVLLQHPNVPTQLKREL